ncbi:MAG: hypothetical protein IJV28_04630 [Paludibacteraceae bacterium]|nr:hypothetical protein [Paludibacteraceae bacterium]
MSKFVQILRSVSFPLGRVGVGLLLFILTACASQAPLDDAYHWMDKAEQMAAAAAQTAQQSATSTSTSSSSSTSAATPTAPSLEYTNVQDTTITVRIKR